MILFYEEQWRRPKEETKPLENQIKTAQNNHYSTTPGTAWPSISVFVLAYFADEFVEGQDFFYSSREIRAGEGGRRDVMKAK